MLERLQCGLSSVQMGLRVSMVVHSDRGGSPWERVSLTPALSVPPGTLSQAARESLIRASTLREGAGDDEQETLARAREDVRLGLTFSHEHVKRLLGPDWRSLAAIARPASNAGLAIVWTRVADSMHLGNEVRERALHAALEDFAATGAGSVFATLVLDEYRLETTDFSVWFQLDDAKMVLLSVRAR